MLGVARRLNHALHLLLPAGAAVLLTAGPSLSQEGGGIAFTFGFEQRVSWEDNPNLKIPSSGDTFRSDTRLSFGVTSETALDRLSFSLGTVLRGEDDGDGFGFGLVSPSAELAYSRFGASSSFTISGYMRESDLGEGLNLIDAGPGNLPILVFDQGSARTKGLRLGYTWGDGMPLGGAFRAGVSETEYFDTIDPDLVDNRTTTLGAGLRFALNQVTDATLDIDQRRYDEDGPAAAEDSTTISAGLVRALPRGNYRGKLSHTTDEDGSRNSLSFGRSFEMPRGLLSVDLGVTGAEGGGTDMTGALDWRQEFAEGQLSANLSRSVSYDESNDETLVTALSLGLTHAISPRSGVNLGAYWAQSEDTDTGLQTETTSLNASVNYALTQDWGLNLGASHKLKDADGIGKTDSSSVFFSIGRSFEWRP